MSYNAEFLKGTTASTVPWTSQEGVQHTRLVTYRSGGINQLPDKRISPIPAPYAFFYTTHRSQDQELRPQFHHYELGLQASPRHYTGWR